MTTIVASMDAWLDKLTENGFIPPATLNEKGRMATTASLPGKTDAAYSVSTFSDGTKCLFVHDFRTGENLQITTKAWRKNGAVKNEAGQAMQSFSEEMLAEQKKAADEAQAEYAKGKPADSEHPYLKKKQVEAAEDIRQDAHGNLLIPIRDINGNITSIQKITPEGAKIFTDKGRVKGCYYKIEGVDDAENLVICIAEGYATAMTIHMATGLTTYSCLYASNLLATAVQLRKRHPDATMIICADNDCSGKVNTGVTKAMEAAYIVGAVVAIPPMLEPGKNVDFNDFFVATGLEAVADVIENAKANGEIAQLPEGYEMQLGGPTEGLYRVLKTNTGPVEIKIADALHIRAQVRTSSSSSWGLLVGWKDSDGRKHEKIIPKDALLKDPMTCLAEMVNEGFGIIPSQKSSFIDFLSQVSPATRRRIVQTTGWHGKSYVRPDIIYAESGLDEPLMLYPAPEANIYSVKGTKEGWDKAIELASSSKIFVTCLCFAAMPCLMDMSGVSTGGLHIYGESSSGKTTATKVAASIFGAYESFRRTWNATTNGLEMAAAMLNGSTLILDELSQGNAGDVFKSIYMLCNETGRARANKELQAREVKHWQLGVLSTGEVDLETKIAEAGLKAMAGQDVRMAQITINKDHFSDLHNYKDSYALTKAIEEGIAANYGHAGRMFHEQVVAHYDEIARDIKDDLKETRNKLCSSYAGASNQISRVAERFALAIIAGRLACNWGVFPFTADVVETSVKACFDNWIKQRGGVGAHEDIEAVKLVKEFIHANRLSRFERIDSDDRQPVMRDLVGRADFRMHEYYFYQYAFKKIVLKGLNVGKALKALLAEGLLRRDDDPGRNLVRKWGCSFYKIVLDDEPDDEIVPSVIEAEPEVDYAF